MLLRRLFSQLFLFTHHFSSLSFSHRFPFLSPPLSFRFLLSLCSPPSCSLSLIRLAHLHSLSPVVLYRALPRRTLRLLEFPVISRRGTRSNYPFCCYYCERRRRCAPASPLALIDHDACRADLRRASSHPISTEMKKKFHCFPPARSICSPRV